MTALELAAILRCNCVDADKELPFCETYSEHRHDDNAPMFASCFNDP